MNRAANALGPTQQLFNQEGQLGTGHYLLTVVAEHPCRSSTQLLKFTLEDASGRVTGLMWPEYRAHITCPARLSPVAVSGEVYRYEGRAQIRVQGVMTLSADQVSSATALIPRQRCPEAALRGLDRLARLEAELPAPLDGFLRNVLLDPAITLPFLRCRASVSHHHSFIGGLLVHSTEMLDAAVVLTRQTLPDDSWSPHIAELGYLLHDLGKLKSVGDVRRPEFALVVPHEFHIFEMLAPHLRWLDQRNIGLAMAMRKLFSYLATPAKARKISNYFVAEVIEMLDQMSAASHNRRDLNHLLAGSYAADSKARAASSFPSGAVAPRLYAAG